MNTPVKPPLPTSESPVRHHNFLSIGARGVGKTVFFVGHYGQSTQSLSSDDVSLQFDCHEAETKETIYKIDKYVAKMGKYPPATMKMTNFDFLVQKNTENDGTPLCEVCWWDTPGESCQLYNPAFLTMMLSVDGSCLFLDGQRLVKSAENLKEVQEQLQPIQTYGDLLHHNGFHYPIALILTKCDLLTNEKDWKTLKQTLKPLRQHWDELGINYRLFYSEIPIVEQEEGYTLQVRSKENALTWLVEVAQANEKSKPKVAIATDSPSEDLPEQPSQTQWGIPVFLRRKAAILVSFLMATTLLSLGGVFLVERAVNSEQGTPAVLPTQS
jgi:GTPase SAR1 family protein